jgi:hypothetical protein
MVSVMPFPVRVSVVEEPVPDATTLPLGLNCKVVLAPSVTAELEKLELVVNGTALPTFE